MSLIVTIPAEEGIVIASDMTRRVGHVQQKANRIYQLNDRVCWSAVGEEALIERVARGLKALHSTSQPLQELLVLIGNIIKTAVREFLAMDFRTDIYLNNINAVTQLHRADFVFVEARDNPVVLHMNATGTPELIADNPYIIGGGDAFACSILEKYKNLRLDLELASLLACRLLKDTIDCGLYGLQEPIDIWQIGNEKVTQIYEEKVSELLLRVQTIREHEVAIFEKQLSSTLSH